MKNGKCIIIISRYEIIILLIFVFISRLEILLRILKILLMSCRHGLIMVSQLILDVC